MERVEGDVRGVEGVGCSRGGGGYGKGGGGYEGLEGAMKG